jgi:hypothetical protein
MTVLVPCAGINTKGDPTKFFNCAAVALVYVIIGNCLFVPVAIIWSGNDI